ncbi:ubiquilin-2-like [Eucyclogobius newberryi]|uniref:ubiquilin-2-like n=1 Tax=Eucyclogobius newberryi TaxID=166745 RepID=UPI003B597217
MDDIAQSSDSVPSHRPDTDSAPARPKAARVHSPAAMEHHKGPLTAGSDAGPRDIQICLQTRAETRETTVTADSTVGQLKAGLAERMGADHGAALIHRGRVLGDTELLSSLQAKDGAVQLSVRRSRAAADASSASTDEDVSSPTAALLDAEGDALTPTSPLFLVEGLDSLGLSHTGPGLFSLLQSQMERQLLSSPEMMHSVLGSSFVQSSLCGAGPGLVPTLILSNPQIQQLLQTNPELEDEINDPELIAEVFELFRNPDLIKEMLKSEEPEVGHSRQQRSNPAKRHFTFPPRTSSTKPEDGAQPSERCTDRLSEVRPPSAVSTGVRSLLEQISSSPGLVESLLSGPHVRDLLQCLSRNPELATQMLLSHPLLSENPPLQQQLGQQLPPLLQQMQSPELLSAVLNPKAVEALLQIQQGLQTLASEAPALIPAVVSDSVLNKPRSDPAVSTATEQQQQFVQQMLQTLANSDHKDLDQLSSEAFEES